MRLISWHHVLFWCVWYGLRSSRNLFLYWRIRLTALTHFYSNADHTTRIRKGRDVTKSDACAQKTHRTHALCIQLNRSEKIGREYVRLLSVCGKFLHVKCTSSFLRTDPKSGDISLMLALAVTGLRLVLVMQTLSLFSYNFSVGVAAFLWKWFSLLWRSADKLKKWHSLSESAWSTNAYLTKYRTVLVGRPLSQWRVGVVAHRLVRCRAACHQLVWIGSLLLF